MNRILCQIFQLISSISSKNMNDNSPIRIYVNKIENRVKPKTKYEILS